DKPAARMNEAALPVVAAMDDLPMQGGKRGKVQNSLVLFQAQNGLGHASAGGENAIHVESEGVERRGDGERFGERSTGISQSGMVRRGFFRLCDALTEERDQLPILHTVPAEFHADGSNRLLFRSGVDVVAGAVPVLLIVAAVRDPRRLR